MYISNGEKYYNIQFPDFNVHVSWFKYIHVYSLMYKFS